MRIAVGADHRGYAVRSRVLEFLRQRGHEVIDAGVTSADPVDYPDIAAAVARMVSAGEVERGILICGTGLGMSIAANKFPGVRAAPCHDDLTAEMSRRHNDLNVLCLSADLLGARLIDRMIEIWLNTPFEGGRHARRVAKITALEQQYLQGEAQTSPKPPEPSGS
ncbi:MAG: ribose 5-phosphate isomerase B [Thermoguttaceae bacterium]